MKHANTRPLVAVDWGTTSLRAALLQAGQVVAERESAQGILAVPAGGFPQVLQALCSDWLALPQALCLISGMAGSAQGWALAPYCPCPAGFADIAQHLHWLEPGRMALVPGLSCEHAHAPDVMRGEEVQIMGALALSGRRSARMVLPGTHSKWVQVEDAQVRSFQTFMTGEVFAALRHHTILARTLPEATTAAELDTSAFTQAVAQSLQAGNVLHQVFGTRTLSLMNRASPQALLSHLSGLLIGEELRAQAFKKGEEILIVGSPALQQRYQLALAVCQVQSQCWGAQATWHGLQAIASSLT
jgi:2-dehydro-3-deoxygalactonokinase